MCVFSSTNKLRNKLENCLHPLQPLGVGCALSLQGQKGPWFPEIAEQSKSRMEARGRS